MFREFSVHECLDCSRDLFDFLAFRKSALHNLFNNLLAVWVIRSENGGPEFLGLTFNKVSSLESEKSILISDHDEFFIALAPRALVSDDSQVRVTFFAELTDSLSVVELVVSQEILRVLIGVNLDLSKSVVDSRDLIAFRDTTFEPVFEHTKLVALFEFFNERFIALRVELATDLLEDDLNLTFFAFLVNESTKHNRSSERVDLIQEDLDVVQEIVLVKVSSEFFDELMDVTQENKSLRIRETQALEEVLDLNWVVASGFLLDDLFNDLELIALSGSFDVLEVDVLVFS